MPRVRRDPFARTEVHSERVYDGMATCRWCGSKRSTPKGKRYMYRYRIEHDGGRVETISGLFCSISCCDSYNG